MKDELLLHLHEQYAINNNSNFSSIVIFIVALLTAFGGYGYIFIHSNTKYDFCKLIDDNGFFSIDGVIISALIVLFVIGIIARICIYQGISQRKEQFLIYKIRTINKLHVNDERFKILPPDYHPFNKEEIDVIQGLYCELLHILKFAVVILLFSLIFKLAQNTIDCLDKGYNLTWNGLVWLFPIIGIVIYIGTLKSVFSNSYRLYLERQEYYEDDKPKNDNTKKKDNNNYCLTFSKAINYFIFPSLNLNRKKNNH